MINDNFAKGFTILEVLVSLSLLIVAFFSLMRIFPWATQISKASEQKTVGVNLAQAKIEEITATSYDEITVGISEPRAKVSEDPTSPFYTYERETKVIYVDPNNNLQETLSDLGIKKVEVTVFWQTPMWGEKSLKLATLISKR